MSKVLKWLHLVIEIRVEDVVRRKDAVELAKHERENAIKLDNARKEKYEKELGEKKAAFDEAVEAEVQKQLDAQAAADDDEAEDKPKPEIKRPEFNTDEFKAEFDLANPEVVIPVAVQEEVDNDYDLAYNAPAVQPTE